MHPTLCFLTVFLAPNFPAAEITARFIKSAPKDRFEIKNTGACDQDALMVRIDLARSAAGLNFDTTNVGAAVEVVRPFELLAGGDLIQDVPIVTEGRNRVDLNSCRGHGGVHG
ncbi:MAG: hypothetical protein ABJL99_18610 [Aliishimia sp.]